MTTITLTLSDETVLDLESEAGRQRVPLVAYLETHLAEHAKERALQAARWAAFRRCASCGQLHGGGGDDETIPAARCVRCDRRMTARRDRFQPTGSGAEYFEVMAVTAPQRRARLARMGVEGGVA